MNDNGLYPRYAIVTLGPLRVCKVCRRLDEAIEEARYVHALTPCEIMEIVRDDDERAIGVRQLSREDMRRAGKWRPKWQMRAEDVVLERSRFDKPEPEPANQADGQILA